MGTEIPHVKYTPSVPAPTYAFSTTRESADLAADAFRKVKDLTVKLSMVENAAYRLATNIKKTQKRANALQNITIPMYTELVYNITNALEEKERERIKGLIINKFRGDVGILRPGLAMLEEKTHLPVFGVVPYLKAVSYTHLTLPTTPYV